RDVTADEAVAPAADVLRRGISVEVVRQHAVPVEVERDPLVASADAHDTAPREDVLEAGLAVEAARAARAVERGVVDLAARQDLEVARVDEERERRRAERDAAAGAEVDVRVGDVGEGEVGAAAIDAEVEVVDAGEQLQRRAGRGVAEVPAVAEAAADAGL